MYDLFFDLGVWWGGGGLVDYGFFVGVWVFWLVVFLWCCGLLSLFLRWGVERWWMVLVVGVFVLVVLEGVGGRLVVDFLDVVVL